MSLDYVSNQEIIQAAHRSLPQDVWDYLTGGAESETTMRRNRLGFDSLGLRPRVLVDVSKVDTSTTFLGQKLRIPVMMAPIGSLQTITPEGGVAVAKAAAEFGTMNFVSSVTQPSLEEIAALRYEDIDFEANFAHVTGAGGRNCTLRDPLRRLLIERRSASRGDAPLANARGGPLSRDDLEGLVTCAACDAGLANPAEVTADAMRHTYFAYLIRQGARLAEIGEFIGGIPPAAFREYGRLSPPGPGLPLEQIEPVFPALRGPAA
jgi:hypothetical protein